MIDYINQNLFLGSSVHKELRITTDDGAVTITNEDLHQEKFELRESLCSEPSLVFGSCEASSIKYTVSNIFGSLKGKWLNLSMILNHDETNPFSIGRYKVDSDVPTANRDHREVVAYDALHDVITAEVSNWYNTVLPSENSTVTLKAFRDSFFAHFDIEQENVALPNDAMIVAKTIQPEELSGKTVIVAICEINGCFGNIGRNGKFRYVFLEQNLEGLYPSQTLFPSDTLFPQDPKTTLISNGTYIPPCKYESYNVQSLSGVLIRKEENDVGAQIGTDDNLYIIQDNFLVYGKSEDELVGIANNIFGRIRDIKYRPFNTKAKGNPCLEVGDAIRLSTKTDRIESYILSRTLSGIQALLDEYTADGAEFQAPAVNTIRHAIIELKNKSNTLTRTVDETRSELKDTERGLTNTISQTADKLSVDIDNLKTTTNTNLTVMDGRITAEISRAQDAEASLQMTANDIRTSITNLEERTSSRFAQTDSSISAEVSRAEEAEASLRMTVNGISTSVDNLAESTSSRFNQTDSSISAEVTRAKEVEARLQVSINGISSTVSDLETSTSSRFTQTNNAITAEVSRAKGVESSLSSQLDDKVGTDEMPSLIRVELGKITIQANQIDLTGYVSAGGGNFTIDESGNLKIIGPYGTVDIDDGVRVTSDSTGHTYWASYSSSAVWFRYDGNTKARIQYNSTNNSLAINNLASGNVTISGNAVYINGGLAITSENISSYLDSGTVTLNSSDTKISYTSVGNINIMSANGYQAESSYKYGNIASTGWVQGKVAKLTEEINRAFDNIAALDSRLTTVEGKV